MQTYVINLDRQPARMARMAAQLGGAAFERVPAVEGRNLSGPERRVGEVPVRAEELTRYELSQAGADAKPRLCLGFRSAPRFAAASRAPHALWWHR